MPSCLESKIVFETTTLEKIVNDPEWVLANEKQFWSEYRAQALVRKWADHNKFEISSPEWREKIQAWISLTGQEKRDHDLVRITERILEVKTEFLAKALPHDCAFLPPGVDLSVTVQFTAFVPPFAFAMEDLVINVGHKYWKGNPEHVLNLLVHEIFHVGYSFYRTLQSEKDRVDPTLYRILDNIVNEGICTYVGYLALPIFPVENERDYIMLENADRVEEKIAQTNQVLERFGEISEEDLQKLSWENGVVDRSYYVSGAHMCQVIDQQAGRQALIEVYSRGPLSIIELYNSLVGPELILSLPV